MKGYGVLFITGLALSVSCKKAGDATVSTAKTKQTTNVEVQGHRGDRGNFPENSLPAFISAVNKGADVLEMDVVISADNKVVVSHEPYMSYAYVLTPKGDSIHKAEETSYNLYKMPYDSIKKYDIGSKGNINFPQQKKVKAYKPLLAEVIDSVEHYVVSNNRKPVRYNIEIKSVREEYGITQPMPGDFVRLVMDVIKSKNIKGRYTIQSFDPHMLNVLHEEYPHVAVSFLVAEPGIDKNLTQLNFVPQIYSPLYNLVNKGFVDSLKQKDIKIIPWTVNDTLDIKRMRALEVDGIISDYPERVLHNN
ncbi:glycerophosphodiester phosphodiesterase family protein [Flavobacterium rhizosphaerae]|uniref:Glycerophosphodiester phosphodiesterase family protein n=1 Tax=Flavobacterium rhizosphaerae TaxID=3163298 RepID=A0ABW8Z319_9FLAO